jgi:hypothetical protein
MGAQPEGLVRRGHGDWRPIGPEVKKQRTQNQPRNQAGSELRLPHHREPARDQLHFFRCQFLHGMIWPSFEHARLHAVPY